MHPLKKTLMWIIAASLLIPAIASLAHAQTQGAPAQELTVERLERGRQRLKEAIKTAQSRPDKLKILSDFHKALRIKIRERSNSGRSDEIYWKAVSFDMSITDMIDKDCKQLKQSIEFSQHSMADNDSSELNQDGLNALRMADQVCK